MLRLSTVTTDRMDRVMTTDRCRNGHLLTPDNIYRSPGRPRTRCCRACRTMWAAERDERTPPRRGVIRRALGQRRARRIARYRAGLILESVINEGWAPPDLVKRYGPEGMDTITQALGYYAEWMIRTGHPDGSAQ